MPNYIVNRNPQPNGDHEVHDEASIYGCLPLPENRAALGNYTYCNGAVSAALTLGFSRANGCAWCASPCHTS